MTELLISGVIEAKQWWCVGNQLILIACKIIMLPSSLPRISIHRNSCQGKLRSNTVRSLAVNSSSSTQRLQVLARSRIEENVFQVFSGQYSQALTGPSYRPNQKLCQF